MAKVQKAEAKALKVLDELDTVYREVNSDYENAFGWQSAPKGNQTYQIDELVSNIRDKNSFYNRKFGEMK